MWMEWSGAVSRVKKEEKSDREEKGYGRYVNGSGKTCRVFLYNRYKIINIQPLEILKIILNIIFYILKITMMYAVFMCK